MVEIKELEKFFQVETNWTLLNFLNYILVSIQYYLKVVCFFWLFYVACGVFLSAGSS
jgi:hypothetical protein